MARNLQQVLAGNDVHTRLRERRSSIWIPVFAVEDARETIAAILDLEVGSEQAGLHPPHFGLFAASDAQMRHHHVPEHLSKQVIEIGPRADAIDEGLVALLGRLQFQTM